MASGSFSITPGGKVIGTLPPGYSKEDPPVDLAMPETAERIRNSTDTSELRVMKLGATPQATAARHKVLARSAVSAYNGCVTASSFVDGGGLHYKGWMVGCSYGHLWLHTYLNANNSRVQDGNTVDCYNSTSCSVPYDLYSGSPNCRTFTNYAHGHNYTTGGDSVAYTIWAPWAC